MNQVIEAIQRNLNLHEHDALKLYVFLERDMHINFGTAIIEISTQAREWRTASGYNVKLQEMRYAPIHRISGNYATFWVGIERVTNTLYWKV